MPWLAGTDATRKAEAGHFVRWAISHGINRNLQFAATRWTGPAGPLDQDGRWQQARRLLHDDTLGTGDRVAGLLVLLYAQRPAAISRLTLDDIDTSCCPACATACGSAGTAPGSLATSRACGAAPKPAWPRLPGGHCGVPGPANCPVMTKRTEFSV